MSSIAGFVPLGGAPADEALLARLAASMSPVSPGGVTARLLPGGAGLVYGALPTGDAAGSGPQPLTLDGRRWIAADARIDMRRDLLAALAPAAVAADAPPEQLVLLAFERWGAEAVTRLHGDFAFAVWDASRRELSCARDRFGLRPFYYAMVAGGLAFGSSIASVLAHPEVGREMDDAWIADFLVHGESHAAESTVYRAVRQLPAGHRLIAGETGVRVERYWALPEWSEPLLLPGPADYADRFRALLDEAVADRTPVGPVGILFSGGRDSTAVAASWRAAHPESGLLRGFTAHHVSLLPDDEPLYSGYAAAHLGIQRDLLPVDDYLPFEPFVDRPEPVDGPLLQVEAVQFQRAVSHAPVLFTGHGGDALLRETPSRLIRLLAAGRPLRAGAEALQYLWWHRRIPRPGIRSWLRRADPDAAPVPATIPEWIAPGLAAGIRLDDRVAAHAAARAARDPHPLRPDTRRHLAGRLWPVLGAAWHPGTTGIPVDLRHPLLDLRLVEFVLSVPPAQWYNDKGLLRIGMADRLPPTVMSRLKTPVRGDPLQVRASARGLAWLGGRRLSAAVARWVDAARVPEIAGGLAAGPSRDISTDLRPLALSLWLERHG